MGSLTLTAAAAFWGLISALSLVIGAFVGVYCPIGPTTNGLFMAFGAGALLFAVAIEMFAHGLRELDDGHEGARNNMYLLMVMAFIGAVAFTVINRVLTSGSDDSASHAAKNEIQSSIDRKGDSQGDYDKPKGGGGGAFADTKPLKDGDAEEGGHGGGGGGHNNPNAAFSIWLGILIDGVPESMMIGFMVAEGELSLAFIVAVFLANFPEAMSASALMKRNGDSTKKIICMWFVLFVGTGFIAALTVLIFPEKKPGMEDPAYQVFVSVAAEGLAAGSMMACIATAMLPEAFEEGGDKAGIATLMGFLASLVVKLTMEEPGGGHGTITGAAHCPVPMVPIGGDDASSFEQYSPDAQRF